MSADTFRLALALLLAWCGGTAAPSVATGAATWEQSLAISLTALVLLATMTCVLVPLIMGIEATYNRVTRTTK